MLLSSWNWSFHHRPEQGHRQCRIARLTSIKGREQWKTTSRNQKKNSIMSDIPDAKWGFLLFLELYYATLALVAVLAPIPFVLAAWRRGRRSIKKPDVS
jgi:hypothetical protein